MKIKCILHVYLCSKLFTALMTMVLMAHIFGQLPSLNVSDTQPANIPQVRKHCTTIK